MQMKFNFDVDPYAKLSENRFSGFRIWSLQTDEDIVL
jgi:hypothetical protein